MCGIAGFVESPDITQPLDAQSAWDLAHRMCNTIRHRGPDHEGVLVERGVSLAMRRLSIVDLSTGNQPIDNEDGSISIVFNGEIYNFQTLRDELLRAGHVFRTSTDTEVIVHAYEEWGVEAFARLRGMFGLAIWDRRSRTLLLARDRVGIKPLHYAIVGGRLYFGSEIKSLLVAPDVPRDIHVAALDHYLSFLYTPGDQSIFKQVQKLAPGHLLIWQDGRARVSAYWSLPDEEAFQGSEADAVARLRDVLADSVRSHLMSDVPLGAFLSGGVDSSVVVALMAEAHGPGVKTFSIGFHESAYDELAFARQVAQRFDTEHHEFVVTPDALTILDRLVWHFDEPFADSSAIPTWYVSQLAGEHVTVVLSGDGGDELFGGYDRYIPHPRVAAFDRYVPGVLRPMASFAATWWPQDFKGGRFLRHVSADSPGRYIDSIRFFGAGDKARLLSPDLADRHELLDCEARALCYFERTARLPWASRMMRFDTETYLPGDILTKVDRMSMAHSIESRVPFLDNDVLQFALTLPPHFKIKDGRRKHVLKEVAAQLLPREWVDRRKQGFGVPLGQWLRHDLRDCLTGTILSRRALDRGYFQPRYVRRLVNEHLDGKRDHAMLLWSLLIFERFLEVYVDGAPGTLVPISEPHLPLISAAAAR
jgi:asparagine synthase (glutamine-hydrolysing)